jgi:positive regulator of sigma E activity
MMTDSGLVLTAEKDLAEVEVSCFEGCHDCSARSLCIGHKHNKGRLSVKNPLGAKPGDEVVIEIPELHYNKALVQLFGGLLFALLAGMGGGYLLSFLLPLSSLLASLFGLMAGLVLGGFGLSRMFQKKNEQHLYPVITDILKKGGYYEQA